MTILRRNNSHLLAFIALIFLEQSVICFSQESNNGNRNSTDSNTRIQLKNSTVLEKSDVTNGHNDTQHHSDTDANAEALHRGIKIYQRKSQIARKKWKKTFEEIRSIVVDFPSEQQKKGVRERSNLFDQWKLFLEEESQNDNAGMVSNETTAIVQQKSSTPTINSSERKTITKRARQRFDGFASWDKLLQQWALHTEHENTSSEVDGEDKTSVNFSPRPAKAGEAILPHTDIGDKSKKIWIVTTASLPWMTGTAVNPLLRAAYMTSGRAKAGGKVTLMLPWLEREADRDQIYGVDRPFDTSEDQEEWIRTWLREEAKLEDASKDLNIAWYIGRHETQENSIYSMGDITALIPADEVDICVLEEPEHLNWYRAPGESWTVKFKHVVGIVHTNYFVYALEQPAALLRAPGMRLLSSWMCRAHCHRIIKLSGTLSKFAPEKELVENVHGVRHTFLDYGVGLSKTLRSSKGKKDPIFGPDAEPKVYFIGKMLWSKGIESLMELLKYAEESADLRIDFDMYGGGPDLEEAKEKSKKLELSMEFHGYIDHAALAPSHKIFVNPSLSEVLCTTVAEALAMGKFVVVPSHPSNDFFAQFPNCLTYANKEEFVGNLYYALTHSPEPMSEECTYALSWEAANERFAAAGCITEKEAEECEKAMTSADAGIEIGLPPLIEDEEQRKRISTTVKNTRSRYREFRKNLAQEVRQTDVLPADIKKQMLNELDKRLELDVDELLSSPKLKIQLSPAKLDGQLLDLYNSVSDNPSADILRTVMGGANVGRQKYYLKNQALKAKTKRRVGSGEGKNAVPQFLEDVGIGENRTATKWIKRTLRRNLQSSSSSSQNILPETKHLSDNDGDATKRSSNKDTTTMLNSIQPGYSRKITVPSYFPQRSFMPHVPRLHSRLPSLLI